MGLLDEPGLNRMIEGGCPRCGKRKLVFRTIVDGVTPFMGGEPVGKVVWSYDGEKFVDGVHQVTCGECEHVLFSADVCPRCHAGDGLKKALETPNRFPVPAQCPSCDDDEVRYTALLPAVVVYEDKRAAKARTTTEPHEPGFHGYRVDCRYCGKVAERLDACPLCDALAPLRPRP
jgi:hypothetical protein